MSTPKPRDEEIRAQAAEFIIDDVDRSPEHEARLQEWLSRSPKHVEEYMRMSGMWETLGDRTVSSVLEDAPDAPSPPIPHPSAQRPVHYQWLAAAATIAILVAGGWWLTQRPETYRTAAGETLAFQLEDRSVVFMNSGSKLSVDFSDAERRLTLVTGEASFEVAENSVRPFVVAGGPTRATAVGTEFIVVRQPSNTVVSVLTGEVLVESDRAEIQDAGHLGKGQQISVDDAGSFEITEVTPGLEIAAWRSHRVAFESTRLEEVVEVFNRFNVTTIEIDEGMKDFRIGGSFDAKDGESFLAFLETLDGVTVRAAPDGTPTISRSE